MSDCNLFRAGSIQLSEADQQRRAMNAAEPKLNPTVYFPPRASSAPADQTKVADRKV